MNTCWSIYTYSIHLNACFSKLFYYIDLIRGIYESLELGNAYHLYMMQACEKFEKVKKIIGFPFNYGELSAFHIWKMLFKLNCYITISYPNTYFFWPSVNILIDLMPMISRNREL